MSKTRKCSQIPAVVLLYGTQCNCDTLVDGIVSPCLFVKLITLSIFYYPSDVPAVPELVHTRSNSLTQPVISSFLDLRSSPVRKSGPH